MQKYLLIHGILGLCISMSFGQVPETDSLALVALYNNTNGDSWTNHTNWLQPDQSVSGWFGITVNGNRVTEIELSGNNLAGTLPAEMGSLSNLTFLNLGSNQITGSIPHGIGNLENLIYLYLNENELTDSIPVEIGQLSNLERIHLGYNELTGSIPDEIGNLSNLTFLVLSGNQLSGSIPESIGNLSQLDRFIISENQIEGFLPPALGNLTNLKYLEARNNELTGEIPAEIGNLSNLVNLYLSFNQLSGEIPAAIFNLGNLESLSLFRNQLTGTIPDGIGNLSNLKSLLIHDNQLSGSIPEQIGMLDKMTSLYIYNNQFTGPLPSGISSLPELGNLRLYNNYFTFSDLEILEGVSFAYFSYSPQLAVETSVDLITASTGDAVGLDITTLAVPEVEAVNNTYQWWKDGDSLSSYSSSPLLALPDVVSSDQGYYRCRMKNPDFPELTLLTDSIYLEIDGPKDILLTPDAVDENVPANTRVGILSAQDPDQSGGHSFTLIEGDGINDADNGFFSINGDSLFINTSPDFETKQEYLICIRATDSDAKTFDKALVVKVNDIQESVPEGVTYHNQTENIISLYPNPVSAFLILEYKSDVGGKLSVTLYDLQGRFIALLFSQKALPPGIHKIYLDFNDRIPPGSYILEINNYTWRQSVLINRK